MTTYLQSSLLWDQHSKTLSRGTIDGADVNLTYYVEGNRCLWNVEGTLIGALSIYVRDYDSSRAEEYWRLRHTPPFIMIKNFCNASALNVTVRDMLGNALHVFNVNNSVTPAYLVLRLTATNTWEVA